MQDTQVWPLAQEMANHSSIPAWKVPWTEKPGRLQSMGLQRVEHKWATDTRSWNKGIPKGLQSFFSTSRLLPALFPVIVYIHNEWSYKPNILSFTKCQPYGQNIPIKLGLINIQPQIPLPCEQVTRFHLLGVFLVLSLKCWWMEKPKETRHNVCAGH